LKRSKLDQKKKTPANYGALNSCSPGAWGTIRLRALAEAIENVLYQRGIYQGLHHQSLKESMYVLTNN
jgi:hypothetical protein